MHIRDLRAKSVIPAALGMGMLGVVVAAALAPDTGAVPAGTACPYGVCPTTTMDLLPWEVTLGVLVAVAVVLAILILRRRRRGGGAAPGPVEPWSGEGPTPPGEGPSPPAAAPAAGVVPAAAYLETPEDVGVPPPAVPAPAVAPPKPSGGEADIDSLMQELDKISNEILKRGGPKSGQTQSADSSSSESESGGGSS